MHKLVKRIVRKLLPQTLCIRINGNPFRENDVIRFDRNKGDLLILRKEIVLEFNGAVSNLYCIRYKASKNKSWNRTRLKLYKWLAYKDLIC